MFFLCGYVEVYTYGWWGTQNFIDGFFFFKDENVSRYRSVLVLFNLKLENY